MSWRNATPSEPAPPLTSTSANSLFPGSTSSAVSTRISRASASSSSSTRGESAMSLLSRQMAEIEDGGSDARSIRSSRSTVTLNGNGTVNGRKNGRSGSIKSNTGSSGKLSMRTSTSTSELRTQNSPPGEFDRERGAQEARQSSMTSTATSTVSNSGKSHRLLVPTPSSSMSSTSSRSSKSGDSSTNSDPQCTRPFSKGEGLSQGNSKRQKILSISPSLSSQLPEKNVKADVRSSSSSQMSVSPTLTVSAVPKAFLAPPTTAQAKSQSDKGWKSLVGYSKGGGGEGSASNSSQAILKDGVDLAGGKDKGREEPALVDPEVIQTPKLSAAAVKAYNDANLPKDRSIESSKSSSWWGWGPASSPQIVVESQTSIEHEATPETKPEPTIQQDEILNHQTLAPTLAEKPVASSATEAPSQGQKGWLRTFWGEFPAEEEARRKAEEAILKAKHGFAAIAPNLSPASLKDAEIHTLASPAASSIASGSPDLGASVATIQPQSAIKHKSSWFFPSRSVFSATDSLASNKIDPVTSGSNEPGSVPSAVSSSERGRLATSPALSKSPLTGLGLTSGAASTTSRASSRSRTDTNASSAPNSPRLLPQSSDETVKPLTGSVRSSPRLGAAEPPRNLVLPTFNDTFMRPPRSFPIKQSKLTKAVSAVSAYLFSQPPISAPLEGADPAMVAMMLRMKEDPAERLPKAWEAMSQPPAGKLNRIKRVVTIGVHGWFPNPKLKSVFGEPTGTSVKFATMMHDSVQMYLESHDVTSFNIQAIALEGHGRVDDRVETLWQRLTAREEWLQALRKADAVFLATHSQGSVVSIHLLARMIKEGLAVGSKTHLLAMCGIAQGPFVYLSQSYTLSPYFNYLENAAARELFDFQDPESEVSKKFLASLEGVLSHGLKVTVVGSINDQVVPLYSALFAGISHPALLRAVYIDSAAFRSSDFLANLVIFSARLRNSGLKDHDLLFHISEALAGALTGVGHSKIYEEEEVFALAVRYQFETTPLHEAPTQLNMLSPQSTLSMSFSPRDKRNPYLLTWALRGIVEDPITRELFSNEMTALREAFETWMPATKVLKEVKMKLEGIRMLPRAKKEGKL